MNAKFHGGADYTDDCSDDGVCQPVRTFSALQAMTVKHRVQNAAR